MDSVQNSSAEHICIDIAKRWNEKQPVSLFTGNTYQNWRSQNNTAVVLREADSVPPERLLQAIWHHQRLLRAELKTLDGIPLRILHPGFWNKESGPDFRDAVVQIGEEIKTGDIEIDLRSGGWRGHGHDRNPNFSKVILHVVWEPSDAKPNLPVLQLKSFLDSPLEELALWLSSDAAKSWPAELSGNCCAPLRDLPDETLRKLLQEAAFVRLQRKGHELQSRARQVGWEQALWEGLLRALGYKHNVWPMQRLAELFPQIVSTRDVFKLQARLLGVSGLLPNELPRTGVGSQSYLKKIWDCWWREREMFSDVVLPKSLWKFHGLRPANHPQRRLALAAHWLASENLICRLEQWFTDELTEKSVPQKLLEILRVVDDEFWSCHWTFRSASFSKPQPLIGETRVTDLAINVILPWFWIRSAVGNNAALRERAETRYFAWPMAEDNSVLKLARQRLLGGNNTKVLCSCALQQGLMQIVRDFCEHSNAVCENCRFPDLVRQFK